MGVLAARTRRPTGWVSPQRQPYSHALNYVMPLSERIVVDPEILSGKPVIRGTRLAVEFILELLGVQRCASRSAVGAPVGR
jgi:hypothetical protein